MLGLDTLVSIGKQSTVALPTTQARQSLNVYSINGGLTEPFQDDNILGGGLQNASDPVAPAPGLNDHSITIQAPLCIAQFGFWLAAFFGTEAASGTTPNYTHLWKSGAALPYVFLEHKLTTGIYRQHYGLVGESMDLELYADKPGFAMATMTFVGIGEVPASGALTGAVTAAPALDRPAEALVNTAYNSVAGFPVLGGKISFKRKLKRIRGADGTGLASQITQDGISTLDGTMKVRYVDETFQADSIARTERDLNFQLNRTSSRGFTFDLPHMRLSRQGINIPGPDGIEQDYAFRAWQNASDAALAATVLNSAATVTI